MAEGRRTEPAVSEPSAPNTVREATDTAEPAEEPRVLRGQEARQAWASADGLWLLTIAGALRRTWPSGMRILSSSRAGA